MPTLILYEQHDRAGSPLLRKANRYQSVVPLCTRCLEYGPRIRGNAQQFVREKSGGAEVDVVRQAQFLNRVFVLVNARCPRLLHLQSPICDTALSTLSALVAHDQRIGQP
jgi:hypothetical protein